MASTLTKPAADRVTRHVRPHCLAFPGIIADCVRVLPPAARRSAHKRRLVRSRGLEPPRAAPLAPQASASTTSATTADGLDAGPFLARHPRHGTNRAGRPEAAGPQRTSR